MSGLDYQYDRKKFDGLERALIVLPQMRSAAEQTRRPVISQIKEAEGLVAAIGLEVIAADVVTIIRPRPSTLFGSGKSKELGCVIKAKEIVVAVVDTELTPIQQRNLERAWQCKVIDRTGLILEIFASSAQT